jgi:hypothetical protein
MANSGVWCSYFLAQGAKSLKQRTAVTLCSLVVSLFWMGCYNTSQLSHDQIERGTDYDICRVVTTAGDSITLKEVSGRSGIIRDSTIVGVCEDGRVTRIPLSQVQSVQVTYFDGGKTVLTVLGISAGVVLVMFLAFLSGGW